jgi:hypothetical protein
LRASSHGAQVQGIVKSLIHGGIVRFFTNAAMRMARTAASTGVD